MVCGRHCRTPRQLVARLRDPLLYTISRERPAAARLNSDIKTLASVDKHERLTLARASDVASGAAERRGGSVAERSELS